MIVIDMDMPKNCVECHEKGIQELLECRLIFSGCANCGRHPKCPIKCDIEDIKQGIVDIVCEESNEGEFKWCAGLGYSLKIIDNYLSGDTDG